MIALVVVLLPSFDAGAPSFGHALGNAAVAQAPLNQTLHAYLKTIADWAMSLDVGSNVLNHSHAFTVNSSIFVNSNLARVLLAAHKLQPHTPYLSEGLRWCDTFVGLQLPAVTSDGQSAGYWNTGYNEVYIADTGTAIVTLAQCHELQPSAQRRAAYLEAMRKFSRFVRYGCFLAPAIALGSTSGLGSSTAPRV